MKLALGPLLYYWPRADVLRFYEEAGRSAAEIVYLGEIICSRRHEVSFDDWLAIAKQLADAGKEVVFSAQALTESEGDLKLMRRAIANGRWRVEANDWGAARLLSETKGWVAGPHLNVYNPQTLALVAELGATRWVAPLEATRELVAGIGAARPLGMESEVFAHGRMPLAFSARCFTARRFNRQKEDCGYACIEYPDGMPLDTREGKPFLAANGIQTQSAGVYCLVEDIKGLHEAGVAILRVSPQSKGTFDVLQVLRDVSAGRSTAGEAREAIAAVSPGELWNGFWHGRPGMDAGA